MRRFGARTTSAMGGAIGINGEWESAIADGSVGSSGPTAVASSQIRKLRNLHRYRHERSKRLNKLFDRYSRKWMLYAGNNFDLYEYRGHEREATENFARYYFDSHDDRFTLYTNNLNSLPAKERLDALTARMKERWRVQDNARGYDKMKLVLEALECFAEFVATERIRTLLDLPEEKQNQFLEYCDALILLAGRVSHDHPDAIAAIIRGAAVADILGAHDKCAGMLKIARVCTSKMESQHLVARSHGGEEIKTREFKPERTYFAGLYGNTPWIERRRDFDAARKWRMPIPRQAYMLPDPKKGFQ